MKKESTEFFDKVAHLANEAAREAQEENRRLGIPNVYYVGGRIVYQMPDGSLTEKSPFKVESKGLKTTPCLH